MADGINDIELRVQEVVFLSHLFVYPEEMTRYARFLQDNQMFTTPLGKGIWKKMYRFYIQYGSLPSEAAMDTIFTEQEMESLQPGINAITDGGATDAGYILDTFMSTMQVTVYRQFQAEVEAIMATGKPNLSQLQDAERKMVSKQAIIRHTGSTHEGTLAETLAKWQNGTLILQQPRIPIPLKGMEFVAGTPIGTVNVIVGSYGTGKTTLLCNMAASLSHTENILYVTLETHPEAIVFKVVANWTGGQVQAQTVFSMPDATDGVEVQKIAMITQEVNEQGGSGFYYLSMAPGQATAAQLEAYVRDLQRLQDIKISTIFVDYAALMQVNSGGGKEDLGWSYVGTIMKELDAVAKSLEVVIWTAAQGGGEKAHTVTTKMTADFKPMRGGQLYGSKEILHDGAMVFGLSCIRSSDFPHLAVGVLSTIKNRYGLEFYDYLCEIDYSTATMNIAGTLMDISDGDEVNAVVARLQEMEKEFQTTAALKRSSKNFDPRKASLQAELQEAYKHRYQGKGVNNNGGSRLSNGFKKAPPVEGSANDPMADMQNSMESMY